MHRRIRTLSAIAGLAACLALATAAPASAAPGATDPAPKAELTVAEQLKSRLHQGTSAQQSTDMAPANWAFGYDLYFDTASVPSPDAAVHPSGVRTMRVYGGTFWFPGSWAAYGKAWLQMDGDGNFVLRDENGAVRWQSYTGGGTGAYACFQYDGNLVVYNSAGQPLKTATLPANAGQYPGSSVHVQTDGNVVIYGQAWAAHWATGTAH